VGHTIGIAHNFAASENDRSSVMDYPHPYVTLQDNKIDLSDAYDKGIGDWDKYVVTYGYKDFSDGTDEQAALQELVDQAKQAGFLYKSDPDARTPAKASADGHLWDNGADPIEEFKRISEVREFALNKFGINSLPYGKPFSELEERLVPIYYAHRFQLDALVKQISGVEYDFSVKSLSAPLQKVTPVDADVQRQALDLMLLSASADYLMLSEELLSLIPPKAYGSSRTRESMGSRVGIAFDPVTAAESAAGYSLAILLNPERLNRVSYQHSIDSEIPSVQEITSGVFERLIKVDGGNALESRIRYVALSVVFDTLTSDTLAPEVKLALQSELLDFQNELSKQKRDEPEARVLLKHLQHYWDHGAWPLRMNLIPLPPGSPI
jgi:hypothetical protein